MSQLKDPCLICGAEKPRGYLMCRDDWYRVPRSIRLALSRAWRAYASGKTKQLAAEYINVRRQAFDAARMKRVQESPLCD